SATATPRSPLREPAATMTIRQSYNMLHIWPAATMCEHKAWPATRVNPRHRGTASAGESDRGQATGGAQMHQRSMPPPVSSAMLVCLFPCSSLLPPPSCPLLLSALHDVHARGGGEPPPLCKRVTGRRDGEGALICLMRRVPLGA